MKTLLIIHALAALMYIGGLIWTIAEALNYYIKDDPFNFGCLWLLGGGIVIAFLNIIVGFFKADKF